MQSEIQPLSSLWLVSVEQTRSHSCFFGIFLPNCHIKEFCHIKTDSYSALPDEAELSHASPSNIILSSWCNVSCNWDVQRSDTAWFSVSAESIPLHHAAHLEGFPARLMASFVKQEELQTFSPGLPNSLYWFYGEERGGICALTIFQRKLQTLEWRVSSQTHKCKKIIFLLSKQ